VGGVPEIVIDRETGFLEKLGDVKAMAADVRKLACDPELAARMGAAAKTRAACEFSADKSVGKYLAYYRAIMATCRCA
jgi:glycosyltransferase involved in cell wall biosynthesis